MIHLIKDTIQFPIVLRKAISHINRGQYERDKGISISDKMDIYKA